MVGDWNGALDDDRGNNDQHMLATPWPMGEYGGEIGTLVPCVKGIPKVSRFCRRGTKFLIPPKRYKKNFADDQ